MSLPLSLLRPATGDLLSLLPAADNFSLDFDVSVNVQHIHEGQQTEESVLSHRVVLASASALFRSLLALCPSPPSPVSSSTPVSSLVSIPLDLRSVPNAVHAFRTMINTLYTGELNYKIAQPTEVLAVSRICQVPVVESKVLSLAAASASSTASPLSLLLASIQQQQQQQNFDVQSCLQAMIDTFKQNFVNKDVYNQLLRLQVPEDETIHESESHSDVSSPRHSAGSTPKGTIAVCLDEQTTKTVPLDEKEGWCRNKKYIEKVAAGFMCTVCRKIYGRYNSVSYHVTIYHRNPPIKCTETGCHFSTREARYIHFHKYYRHHIPLPNNIDLGSRKCPYCRHVSKSPAMLEKHIQRHGLNGRKEKNADEEKFIEQDSKSERGAFIPPTSQTTPSSTVIFNPSAFGIHPSSQNAWQLLQTTLTSPTVMGFSFT